MVETLTERPYIYNTSGNLIPHELEELTSTSIFTASNCTLTILPESEIDGYNLKGIRVTAAW